MGNGAHRVLDPVERVSEVLFGLIMVLSFTGSLSIATAGHSEVREMLVGAIGCNLAWGIVDAVMWVMSSLAGRGRGYVLLRAVRTSSPRSEAARHTIASALPEPVAAVMSPDDLDALHEQLAALPDPPARPGLSGDDVRGAFGVFLLVFLTTFPVVLPFLFVSDLWTALRVSNAIAIVMLFLGGMSYGQYSGLHPGLLGIGMAVLGIVLVAITIALGG
jgi:hypothetical protein